MINPLKCTTLTPCPLGKGAYDMLILTRRISESIIIGDDVKITVLGVKGNQVRLGVDAPKEVSVHREEIYQRIQQEKNTIVFL